MKQVAGEMPLEATWVSCAEDRNALVSQLAKLAARLHDAGFVHTDFSERHILVGQQAEPDARDADQFTFRLIDLERASVGRLGESKAAADLKALAASVQDLELRRILETDLIDEYVALRRTLSPSVDFHALLDRAQPTRTFQHPKRTAQPAEM